MRHWLSLLAITSVVSGIIELAFWITDQIEGRPFQGGWLLLSSIIWATSLSGSGEEMKMPLLQILVSEPKDFRHGNAPSMAIRRAALTLRRTTKLRINYRSSKLSETGRNNRDGLGRARLAEANK